jgi:prepilin-type processing-associated H-X9-DG protein
MIGLRHHNRSNVFWADGHVDLFDSLTLKDESVTRELDNPVYMKYFRLNPQ